MSLEEGPFVFRVNDNGTGPNLLIQVCMERGWREYTENTPLRDNWNLWWKTSAFSVSQHKQLKAWQFTNHIPKGASICRKDNLARYLKCMKKVYGAVYDISPHGYNLPLEYTKLVADCSRHGDDEENQKVWICKPVGQSQGRGIFLFKSLSDLCYDSNAVVQRYIKNPLLIGGYKFDLRLYVCVPSYHPLTIYLYKEGIVRFSTDKFSLSDLNNPFCHLTNSSLNKLGPGYAEQKDRVGAGCKWNFKQLRHYFQQAGIRDWLLWQRISALVTLTVLSQSTSVPQTTNCFEFYGFDVLVDENLKPWLLEVNLSPALGNDCDVDPVVKKPLLHDLFDLLGLPVCNTGLSLFTIFSPFDTRTQSSSVSPSDNEDGDESENRHLCIIRTKPRAATSIQTNRGANKLCNGPAKTTASSAMLVATAATKWRRKRKTNYLFGPPHKNNLDFEKLKTNFDNPKPPLRISPQNQNVNDSARSKSQTQQEDKKKVEKLNEIGLHNLNFKDEQTNELIKYRQGKKSAVNVKRNRDKDAIDKVKLCCGTVEVPNRVKMKYDCTLSSKMVNGADYSKNSSKPLVQPEINDNFNKKESKLENIDSKLAKGKSDTKCSYVCEKPKKVYSNQNDNNIKSVMLPYDKSYSTSRGFKGRTKQSPPMLWGNGRDWRMPINHEGDWGRIYPLNNYYNSKFTPEFEEDYMGNKFSVGDKQIRLVVHHVTKYIKISKQIFANGIHCTEEELNAQLMNHLGLTGDVWLPSK